MPDQGAAPPGWYPDAQPGRLRWWDGTGWTAAIAPEVEQIHVRTPDPVAGRPVDQVQRGQVTVSDSTEAKSELRKEHRGGFFGGKRELEAELERLHGQLDALGFTERIALQTELTELRSQVSDLSAERDALKSEIQPLRTQLLSLRGELDEEQSLPPRIGELRPTESTTIPEKQPVMHQRPKAVVELTELERQIIETG